MMGRKNKKNKRVPQRPKGARFTEITTERMYARVNASGWAVGDGVKVAGITYGAGGENLRRSSGVRLMAEGVVGR